MSFLNVCYTITWWTTYACAMRYPLVKTKKVVSIVSRVCHLDRTTCYLPSSTPDSASVWDEMLVSQVPWQLASAQSTHRSWITTWQLVSWVCHLSEKLDWTTCCITFVYKALGWNVGFSGPRQLASVEEKLRYIFNIYDADGKLKVCASITFWTLHFRRSKWRLIRML